jgi:carbon monoxide dehydrogenase subunit G
LHLEGKHQFNATPTQVWSILMDPDTLAKITPGITQLVPQDKGNFHSVADIKIGPVRGSFAGKVQLQEINEPSSFSLHVEQDSKIGNVNANIRFKIDEISEGLTKIHFAGDAILSGLIARTGQRILSGVSRTLISQFFQALEKELLNQ